MRISQHGRSQAQSLTVLSHRDANRKFPSLSFPVGRLTLAFAFAYAMGEKIKLESDFKYATFSSCWCLNKFLSCPESAYTLC